MASFGAPVVAAAAVVLLLLAAPHAGANVVTAAFGVIVKAEHVTPPSALTSTETLGLDFDVCYMDDSEDGAFDADEPVLFHDRDRGDSIHALDAIIANPGAKRAGDTVGDQPWVGLPLTCGTWPWPEALRFHDGGYRPGAADEGDLWILSADAVGGHGDLVVAGPRDRAGTLLRGEDVAWDATLVDPPGQTVLAARDLDADSAWSVGDALFLDHDADRFVSNGDIDWSPTYFGEFLAGSIHYGRVLEPAASVPQFDVCGEEADGDTAWDSDGALYLHPAGTDTGVAAGDVRILLPEYKARVAGTVVAGRDYDVGDRLVCGVFDLGDLGWLDGDRDGALDESEAPVLARGDTVAAGDVVFNWEGRDEVVAEGHSALGEPVISLDMTRLRFVDEDGNDTLGQGDTLVLDRDVGTSGGERYSAGDLLLFGAGFSFRKDPTVTEGTDGTSGPPPGHGTTPTAGTDATDGAVDETTDATGGGTPGPSTPGRSPGVSAVVALAALWAVAMAAWTRQPT